MPSIDASDMRRLAADMGVVTDSILDNTEDALKLNAIKVRSTWRQKLQGSATLPALPAAVTFDIEREAGGVGAEIGFDKGRAQGALGNISEFGVPGTAPRGFGAAALAENAADFETGVSKAADTSLRSGDL